MLIATLIELAIPVSVLFKRQWGELFPRKPILPMLFQVGFLGKRPSKRFLEPHLPGKVGRKTFWKGDSSVTPSQKGFWKPISGDPEPGKSR